MTMLNNCCVLVTGGAGFIGANLVRMLVEAGAQVRILDDFSVGSRACLNGLPVEVVEGSILDRGLLARVVPSCQALVHLAAQTGVPGSIADPWRDCEMNVMGTLNLLEACRSADSAVPRRFVFASSNAPLGRQPPPAVEDKAPLPISPYGASKLAGEGYCLAYAGSWGLPTVVLRFANVYGPWSGHKNSVVAKFFKDMLSTGRITLDGGGAQTRDFIYVGDLCRAILLGLQASVSGEVFQIATGMKTSIRELAARVQEIVGTEIEVDEAPFRQGDIRENYSAISKAALQLGWAPVVEIDQGLRDTYAWFRAHFHREPQLSFAAER